jgi:hypothetical protein
MSRRSNTSPLIAAAVAALGTISGSAVHAQSGNWCPGTNSGTTALWQIGTPSADSEKDTIGFSCGPIDVEATLSIATFSQPVQSIGQVGSVTGDPEKDTIGYVQLK